MGYNNEKQHEHKEHTTKTHRKEIDTNKSFNNAFDLFHIPAYSGKTQTSFKFPQINKQRHH